MRALIILGLFTLALILTYFAGVRDRSPSLKRDDRKELEELRDLRYWLLRSAAEHQALGDDYAVIVGQKLDDYFKKGSNS